MSTLKKHNEFCNKSCKIKVGNKINNKIKMYKL